MDLGKVIAYNLKELRTSRNFTLGELSRISGISKTMLSDIEKGSSNPTINTIWKLANGLNVPYTRLMEDVETESEIVKSVDAIMQTGESKQFRVYCYFPSTPNRNFELFYCELDARSSNASIGHSDGAREYIYVMDGELVLHIDTRSYTIGNGDAITFDSSIGHTYINQQDCLLRFMVINFYPV